MIYITYSNKKGKGLPPASQTTQQKSYTTGRIMCQEGHQAELMGPVCSGSYWLLKGSVTQQLCRLQSNAYPWNRVRTLFFTSDFSWSLIEHLHVQYKAKAVWKPDCLWALWGAICTGTQWLQHATRSKWWHFEVPFAEMQMSTHGTRQQGIRIYPPVIFPEEDTFAVSPWGTSQIWNYQKKGGWLVTCRHSCMCFSFHIHQTTWTHMVRTKLIPPKDKAFACEHALWKTPLAVLTAFTPSQIASVNAIVHLLSKHKEISLFFGGSFLMGKRD